MARVRVTARYVRIAPRKVRLVADLIRGKKASAALAQLRFSTKRGADPVSKLLNSALASAKQQYEVDPLELRVSKITVDEGPKLKRWRARARGAAYQIQKKSSHINLELEVGEKVKRAETASKPVQAVGDKESAKKTAPQREPKRPGTEAKRREMRRGGMGRIFRRKAI